ncbi:MBL fold metallo-hydrolase [Piscinibacter koreensis]|uniref:MBL fold metallo-hydrolase n=1 Tax=Piscinibacter koreensis TaxID=2742824 RepID=A0A7Y6TVG7_9BURK|nr:MBL fold metallo-hydrolase [Schlegelella koreensis]
MTLRFCSLGSGSSGNATLVEARSGSTVSRLLIDCGFSQKDLETRLQRAGLAPSDLDAIFVTHEHGDHVGCSVALARRHGIDLWMSRGTWRALGEAESPGTLRFARDGEAIVVGDLLLEPFTVAHDAAEPLQLRCSDGAALLGVLTDAGSITPHMLEHLAGIHALLLECNHDRALLAASRYPPSLKARIGGRFGHLSNETAAEILAACMHDGLGRLVAAHLSRENNSPDLARRALADTWGSRPADIVIADPQTGFDWLVVG